MGKHVIGLVFAIVEVDVYLENRLTQCFVFFKGQFRNSFFYFMLEKYVTSDFIVTVWAIFGVRPTNQN